MVGDLASIAQTRKLAEQVNALGPIDAVIHNAGIGYPEAPRADTEDCLPPVFAVNVLAPYILTALIERPKRLVYLSSGMHCGATTNLDDLAGRRRSRHAGGVYAESKLHDVLLAFGVARRWPGVLANALEPGWVATRMGGPSAPDDLDQAHRTQVWLAVSDDKGAQTTGEYFFFHMRPHQPNPAVYDVELQDRLTRPARRCPASRRRSSASRLAGTIRFHRGFVIPAAAEFDGRKRRLPAIGRRRLPPARLTQIGRSLYGKLVNLRSGYA